MHDYNRAARAMWQWAKDRTPAEIRRHRRELADELRNRYLSDRARSLYRVEYAELGKILSHRRSRHNR